MIPLWLTGCAGPRIDGTTEASLVKTIDQVRSVLPEDQLGDFDLALMLVAFSQIDGRYVEATRPEDIAEAAEQVRAGLDGLSTSQIWRQAAAIKAREQKRVRSEWHH
ncbi:MAG: DUF6694 family lipoprotein [Thalassolituus sp.]